MARLPGVALGIRIALGLLLIQPRSQRWLLKARYHRKQGAAANPRERAEVRPFGTSSTHKGQGIAFEQQRMDVCDSMHGSPSSWFYEYWTLAFFAALCGLTQKALQDRKIVAQLSRLLTGRLQQGACMFIAVLTHHIS